MTETRTPQQLWEATLGELQLQVNKSNFHTWLKGTVGLRQQEEKLVVGVPNTFVSEYLERNLRSLIEKAITQLTCHSLQVQFEVNSTAAAISFRGESRRKAISPQQGALPLFNPKYTFDSFVVGNGNQLAYAAALGIAENPGYSYNPLVIHAGPGLGKTHLLQAIGNFALSHGLRVLYVSAEQYTNELLTALREKKTEEFRSKYRSADMLLVDDVQFLSGKEQTGENFFHTFNELHNHSRQIAITCDQPPKNIPSIPERLRSRLEWGLITNIQPPDFDTRLSILQTKAKEKGADVSSDVLELIALQIFRNIRALEGSLNRIIAYAKLIRSKVTRELAAEALRDITGNEAKAPPPTPALIVEAVVSSFQLTPADLKSRKKDETTVLARHVAMYLIRQETDCSLAEVGRELGGRSPATVSHAYQKIAEDLNTYPSLQHKVFEIRQKLYSSSITAIPQSFR
ncbi:MAG: chromosomal replication initiator protein DnaA [Chloroflexi bacterium]|nr:chromosomal replication initiator protein DnaA [Chloroflexota bacterium]